MAQERRRALRGRSRILPVVRPRLEVPLCGRGLGERKLVLDAELETALPDPPQDVSGPGEELLPRGGVVAERRARQVERAALRENLRIERLDRAARLPEEDHRAAGRQARRGPSSNVVLPTES